MDFNGNVESTQRFLEKEVQKNQHTFNDPFGNAASYRKVVEYLYACVVSGKDMADAKDWLYQLYANQSAEAKETFNYQVELVADVLSELKRADKLK